MASFDGKLWSLTDIHRPQGSTFASSLAALCASSRPFLHTVDPFQSVYFYAHSALILGSFKRCMTP